MERVSEEELVYLIHQGSDVALSELLSRYRQFFRAILNQSHFDLAKTAGEEDLIQEAMVVLTLVIERYRDDVQTTFKTFVRSCVVRRWMSVAKKANKLIRPNSMMTISLDAPIRNLINDDTILTVEDSIPEYYLPYLPDKELIFTENMEMIYYQTKESVMEYAYDITHMKMLGYSDKEIANILSINERKVSNTIYRIRKKLEDKKQ